jgi:acyl-coenzyme A thioesterase PaaI-like protein
VIKPGRTIIVAEGHAYDGDGKLAATMTATNMTIVDRPDVEIKWKE